MLPWMLPVLAGMIVSIPLSVFSSRTTAGRRARALGLFCTPEEIAPTPELQEIEAGMREPASATARGSTLRGVMQAVLDPYVNAIHVCLLRRQPRQADELRRHFAEQRQRLLREGPAALPPDELRALLSDVESMDWLHREVWLRPRHTLALPWRRALRASHSPRRLAA
jgi:membrane glycosyltransferase